MKRKKRLYPLSLLLRGLCWLGAGIALSVAVLMIGYILIKGIPNLSWELFAWEYNSENVSMMPAIVNTVTMVFFSLLFAVPIGIGAAVFLTEYARRGNKFVSLVRLAAETLSGIPSIVYGLFGYLLFVIACRMGYSLLGGALTLAIMILPLVMRTTEEALLSVPDSYREGSFALGAGRIRTIFRIVLPAAAQGILASVILAMGRIEGETAALIFTAGTVAEVPSSLLGSGRTLVVHMYVLLNEGLYRGQAHATAVILLALVIGMNALSAWAAKKVSR